MLRPHDVFKLSSLRNFVHLGPDLSGDVEAAHDGRCSQMAAAAWAEGDSPLLLPEIQKYGCLVGVRQLLQISELILMITDHLLIGPRSAQQPMGVAHKCSLHNRYEWLLL